jgi:hypothetical protein
MADWAEKQDSLSRGPELDKIKGNLRCIRFGLIEKTMRFKWKSGMSRLHSKWA